MKKYLFFTLFLLVICSCNKELPEMKVEGCTDSLACNYNPVANANDNSCTYPGCDDPTACNYDPAAGCDDGSCLGLLGCTDSLAMNYNPLATCDDGSCCFVGSWGCTNPTAINYNPSAECDDGSCYWTARFYGYDSFGDEWNGANYTITDDSGTLIVSGDGSGLWNGLQTEFMQTFSISAGCYDLVVTGGSYPLEVSFDLWILTNNTSYNLASGSPGSYSNLCIGLN